MHRTRNEKLLNAHSSNVKHIMSAANERCTIDVLLCASPYRAVYVCEAIAVQRRESIFEASVRAAS